MQHISLLLIVSLASFEIYGAQAKVIDQSLNAKLFATIKLLKTQMEYIKETESKPWSWDLMDSVRDPDLRNIKETIIGLFEDVSIPEINCTDEEGNTPLMCASLRGLAIVVDFLISKNARIDEQNKNGDTALMLTPLSKENEIYGDDYHLRKNIAESLLVNGANPGITNLDHNTAYELTFRGRELDWAIRHTQSEIAHVIRSFHPEHNKKLKETITKTFTGIAQEEGIYIMPDLSNIIAEYAQLPEPEK